MILFAIVAVLLASTATVAERPGALHPPADTGGKALRLRESAATWPRLVSSDPSPSCDCSGCADEDTVRFGQHKDLLSDVCPEGSVATVTKLRASSDSSYGSSGGGSSGSSSASSASSYTGSSESSYSNSGGSSDSSDSSSSGSSSGASSGSSYSSSSDSSYSSSSASSNSSYSSSSASGSSDTSSASSYSGSSETSYSNSGGSSDRSGSSGSNSDSDSSYAVDDRAHFNLVVKNARDGSDYVYRQVRETACREIPPENLPMVGDQDQIEVTLNCEAFTCGFRWDVEFGCRELGVLTTAAGGGLQVLSDVDDTIACGVDRRLERNEMYPGAAELYLGLALGPGGGDAGRYAPAKPMMLSGRPREAKDFQSIDQTSEINVYMESVGRRWNFPSWGVNTDGSMYGTIFDRGFTETGRTKAKSYNSLSDSRPNTRFAFVGDNGQGDPCGAQSMLESPNGGRMEAVLIHEVVDPADVHARCERPQGGTFSLDLPESDRVHYFRTHSNAAAWALEKDLISCCSASAVHHAVNEFVRCRCGDDDCPADGLNTGVTKTAMRSETLEYCREIEADQEILLEAIEACDLDGSCPSASEFKAKSLANVLLLKGKWNTVITALTCFFS